MNFGKVKKIYFLLVLILAIVSVLLLFLYLQRIHFIGEFGFNPAENDYIITTLSPTGRVDSYKNSDRNTVGYFNEIVVETNKENELKQVFYFDGKRQKKQVASRIEADGKYHLDFPQITFCDKLTSVFYYSRKPILSGLVFIALLSLIVLKLRFVMSFVSKGIKSLLQKLNDIRILIFENKKPLLISLALSCCVYPAMYWIFGINFSVLYNVPHSVAFVLTLPFVFITVFGFATLNKLKQPAVFAAFWFIFFAEYFVVSPYVFAGNFGFHGFFHSFITDAADNGFFSSLLIPDTGYLAILPRLIYAIAAFVNPHLSQVMAITSLFTLLLYAFLISSLLNQKMAFLWVHPVAAYVFVVFIGLFPVFSLVPGIGFPLSITDVSYYAILFLIVSLFICKGLSKWQLFFLTLVCMILGLSKAHMVMLIPVFLIALALFIIKKNKLAIAFTSLVLAALVVQAIFCYFSLVSISSEVSGSIGSFSLQVLSLKEQIGFAIVYFIKSYSYILFPYAAHSTGSTMLTLIISTVFICGLIVAGIYFLFKNKLRTLTLWFLACNITAFSTSLFYAYTYSPSTEFAYNNLFEFVRLVDISLMRYTIGVHTLLAVSVIPYICALAAYLFSKINFKFANKFGVIVLTLIVLNGFVFHRAWSMFPEFWKLVKNDKWSSEWAQIAPLLNEKEFYVPIVFYPMYKQNMSTAGVDVAKDFLPQNKSSFSFDSVVPVKTIIVLNIAESKSDEVPRKVELYSDTLLVGEIKPYYNTDSGTRFIVFVAKNPIMADRIVFINNLNMPVNINTHIRVVSQNNSQ